MLVLFETAAGYAIFKLLDEKRLKKIDQLYQSFDSVESASSILKLKQFKKFKDTTEALEAAAATIEGKMSKSLKKLLKKLVVEGIHEELAVSEAKLGNVIKEKFNISCVANNNIQELMRCIRSQVEGLISGLPNKEMAAMALGLAHSLSRYKLKFSPDKVDTMIVQAVGLLDDLDKELNNYVMRTREWYGWHFPELGKLITDNLAFVKTVKKVGFKTNASTIDLSDVLPEEIEEEVKLQAEISMGSEISEDDIQQIQELCDEVLSLTEYRAQLYEYLKNRMAAIAPNLTVLVGELVGARLISHAGSLMNLAKHPASTVQILGAEKALFRALKTKHDTPKYGLIYHAQLIGQSSLKNKGKMSRMLAAKAALAIRVDALGEDLNIDVGLNSRTKLESALKKMEDKNARKSVGSGKANPKFDKYENKSFIVRHDDTNESTIGLKRKEIETSVSQPKKKKFKADPNIQIEVLEESSVIEEDTSQITSDIKKIKKKKKKDATTSEEIDTPNINLESTSSEKIAKKKKKSSVINSSESEIIKKKKKKNSESSSALVVEPISAEEKPLKKKKVPTATLR